jgi:hypothetical protein
MNAGVLWLIIMTVSISAVIFGIAYFKNKENMAMIDRGIPPRDKRRNQPTPFISLKFGALLFGAGAGLLGAFFIDSFEFRNVYNDAIPALYFGMIGTCAGLGFVTTYIIEMKYWNKKSDSQTEGE